MKKLLYLFVFLCCTLQVQGQNIVYNGDFENYITCPTGNGQISRCDGWWMLTNGTTDYYACSFGPSQFAASGSAFMGIYIQTLREYITGALATPMQVGRTYEVSVSVRLHPQAIQATDDMGVYFFKNGPAIYNMSSVLPVTPQVSFASYGPVTNSSSWLRMKGYVFADSAYDKIVIGSFMQGISPNAVGIPGGTSPCYYFFDSTVVHLVSNLTINYADSMMCIGNPVSVPYTVKTTTAFQGNNVFTLQLSSATGSFATPTVLATQAGTASGTFSFTVPNITPGNGYRMRVVSSNFADISDTTTIPISIGNIVPVKPVITATNPACIGKMLDLGASTGTTGVSYKWSGPGSFTSTLQNPSISNVSNANAGNYIVTVRLYGCTAKDTETVMVNPMPLPVTAGSNSPVCQYANPLNLTATNSTPGAMYSWSGPSFTSALQNPSVVNPAPAASGDYIVSANLNGCIEKDTVTVTVLAAPGNVNATANTPVCSGQTLNLGVTNITPGVSYNWSGPSFTSTQQNPAITNVTLAAAGNYIATLSLNGCVAKDTVAVTVKPTPVLTPFSNAPVCLGDVLQLNAGVNVPGATFTWVGPSFSSVAENPVVTGVSTAAGGIYTVTASLNGCTSAPATTNVTIQTSPATVSTYLLPGDTVCSGSSIQFIAIASNGGPNPQYRWLKNGSVIPGANSISYTTAALVTGDKFSVELTPDNTCPAPDTSTPVTITVLPWVATSVSITADPSVPISPWRTITFHAIPVNGGKNPTYQWKRNGQDIVGAINDTWGAYTLSDNDEISVVLYSSEYCPSPAAATSNKITIHVKLGVDDIDNASAVTLYPNPNNGSFTLKGNIGSNKTVAAEIWNSIGQLVYSNTLQPQNNILNTEITIANSPAQGVYILKLNTEEGTKLLRFTINQ